jgi:transposase
MYRTLGRAKEQLFLLPENIKDWVCEDDFSLILLDLVSLLDLSPLFKKHREDGQGAAFYHPEIMVGLIIYSYFDGVRSSRQIETKCRYDVGYRIVTRNSLPDHTTISRFIKKNSSFIGNLFIPVLSLLNEAGFINNKLLALDGTKMKANASLNSNLPYKKIESDIERYLREVKNIDHEEDLLYGPENSGNEVPDVLKTHAERMKRFRAAKTRLEAEQAEKTQKKEEQISQREEEEKESGRKKRGRKPKKPRSSPEDQSLANITDPDSSLMKSGPGCIQGYNGQILVNQDGFILVPLLSNSPVDYRLLQPSFERLKEISELTGFSIEYLQLLTDAGYWSYENYQYMKMQEIGFLCSTCHEPDIFKIRGIERNLLEVDNISELIMSEQCSTPMLAAIGDWCTKNLLSNENETPPTPASVAKGIMEIKMTPYASKRTYAKRKVIVEPVFGWIKQNRGIRKLSRRGLEYCQDEWNLICLTQNLRKVCSRGSLKNFKEFILQKKQEIHQKMNRVIGILDIKKMLIQKSTLPEYCV